MKLLDNVNMSLLQLLRHITEIHTSKGTLGCLVLQNDGIYSRDSLLAFFSLKESIQSHTCVTSPSHLEANPEILFNIHPGRKEFLFSEEIKVELGFQEWPLFSMFISLTFFSFRDIIFVPFLAHLSSIQTYFAH